MGVGITYEFGEIYIGTPRFVVSQEEVWVKEPHLGSVPEVKVSLVGLSPLTGEGRTNSGQCQNQIVGP